MQSNFIEITLRHKCYPVNLLHIFRACFPEYTSGRLLLKLYNVTPKFLLFLVFSCYNRHCLKIYSKAPIEECLKEMIVRIIEFKSIADLKNRYQIQKTLTGQFINLPTTLLKKYITLRRLRSNKNVVITRPDEGTDVVILDKAFQEEKTL